MTDKEFEERLISMRETMYRVSYSQFSQACDRDDAVQDTLLIAWSKRHTLKDERLMQTWIVRILINECHNIHRKMKRQISLDELPERIAPEESTAELHDALFRLDEKLRLPIVLHYIEGFQVKEIAEILQIPQGTVMWRMSKARKELSKMLGNEALGKGNQISHEEA